MKNIDKNNSNILEIITPKQKNKSDEFVPQNNSYSVDELLDVFLHVHPSEFSEFRVEVDRKGCILLFPPPQKIVFNFLDQYTGESCIVDYIWSDIVRKEDL